MLLTSVLLLAAELELLLEAPPGVLEKPPLFPFPPVLTDVRPCSSTLVPAISNLSQIFLLNLIMHQATFSILYFTRCVHGVRGSNSRNKSRIWTLRIVVPHLKLFSLNKKPEYISSEEA